MTQQPARTTRSSTPATAPTSTCTRADQASRSREAIIAARRRAKVLLVGLLAFRDGRFWETARLGVSEKTRPPALPQRLAHTRLDRRAEFLQRQVVALDAERFFHIV